MAGLFAHRHHVGKQIGKELLRRQRGGEGSAIDHGAAHLDHLDFEIPVAGDLRHEIDRAQQRDSVLHESAEGARELRVVAVPHHAAVPGDHEPEPVPADPAFVRTHERPEGDDEADKENENEPPVGGDKMIYAEQNLRRQREGPAVLRHEAD